MISDWFDRYNLQSRLAPGLLSMYPLFWFVAISFPELYTIVNGLISLVLACGILTIVAHYTRSRGKVLEKRLNLKWGGRPTTLFLFNRNNELDSYTHQRYVQFFKDNIPGWTLGRNPGSSYESAVNWLREHTRDKKRYYLIFQENISYGFRRNCLGIKPIGLLMTVICTIIWGVEIYNNLQVWSQFLLYQLVGFVPTLALLVWWIFFVNESWVHEAGDAYAKALLGSIDTML